MEHRTRAYQPSRTALATRSLTAVMRLKDAGQPEEYRTAMAQHFSDFIAVPKTCPLR